MALIAFDDCRAGLLVSVHYLAPFFGVEALGEGSRVHKVTEHHRELTALGFRCSRVGLGGRGRCCKASCLLSARRAFTFAALGGRRRLSNSQRAPTRPAELELRGILRVTARTSIRERPAT